jgi:hypothetical protein
MEADLFSLLLSQVTELSPCLVMGVVLGFLLCHRFRLRRAKKLLKALVKHLEESSPQQKPPSRRAKKRSKGKHRARK